MPTSFRKNSFQGALAYEKHTLPEGTRSLVEIPRSSMGSVKASRGREEA